MPVHRSSNARKIFGADSLFKVQISIRFPLTSLRGGESRELTQTKHGKPFQRDGSVSAMGYCFKPRTIFRMVLCLSWSGLQGARQGWW
jgi:hypothetical protein